MYKNILILKLVFPIELNTNKMKWNTCMRSNIFWLVLDFSCTYSYTRLNLYTGLLTYKAIAFIVVHCVGFLYLTVEHFILSNIFSY